MDYQSTMEDDIPFKNFTPPVGESSEHWQGLMNYLNSLGSKELDRRWQKAKRIMHEHGAAYNIFSGKKGGERPWELDPVPYPISTATWSFLEKGISQRTRLLTAIYNDIYGPQTLISNNHLPPELLFANPRFLRQCHNLYNQDSLKLHFHATDLCRLSDGEWRVISDQAQSPSGAGYALENRIILSRILPRMFHSGKVMRLAPFFKQLTNSLMEISRLEKREPNIVMLSSGPFSPAYFEHVFLSRYLGFTLVESSDLTVRNDAVFLKMLGGLHPVDVILRQIDDAFCDPFIFATNSVVGVPGLAQAIRAKNVDLCNPLGSGVLETPAFIPFLPALCRLILGEELMIQNMPDLWGKNAESPKNTTNSNPLPPCTLPVWSSGKLENCSAAIRVFSTAMNGSINRESIISVMPGALTLISNNPKAFVLNNEEGLGSKDTWCFSDDIVEHKSMMHRFTESVEIHRGGDLPSRVADNMLWLGRYVERTEGMLRVIRSVLKRLNSETKLDMIGEFPFLMRIMANLDIISSAISEPADSLYSMRILESEILESMLSIQRQGSIRNSIQNVRRVASSVRDRLSNDSWQILGRMENELTQFRPHRYNRISEAQELVNELILTMSAFSGLALESMTRSMGWRFMDMGRRIERADCMITMLQSLFSSKVRPKSYELEALLEVADSTITYHTRYRTTFKIEPIVDLLLLDELNPRAVEFQMATLSEHVETLPRSTPRPFRTREEKITLELTTHLRLTDIKELMQIKEDGTIPKLSNLLELLKKGIQNLAEQITQHYLSRIKTEKQLQNFFE
ncbi:MAG: circularly permuted type 2 ATP-grasp protein [Desulfamplus sp.]|nr:circularly permuted type 2 ATP-grasp protein [Desulfamplus sp.]